LTRVGPTGGWLNASIEKEKVEPPFHIVSTPEMNINEKKAYLEISQ
jgi:hypothetical protein